MAVFTLTRALALVLVVAALRPGLARPEPPSDHHYHQQQQQQQLDYAEDHDGGDHQQQQDDEDAPYAPSDVYGAPFAGMTTYRARPMAPMADGGADSSSGSGYLPTMSQGGQGVSRPWSQYGQQHGRHRVPQRLRQAGHGFREPQSGWQPSAGHGSMKKMTRPFSGYASGPQSSGLQQGYGGSGPQPMYGPPSPGRGQDHDDDMSEDAMYRFEYSVGDEDGEGGGHQGYGHREGREDRPQFGQHEEREGGLTRGSYHVLLPDGRLQRVDYEADEHGFRPTVSFEDQRRGSGPY